MAEEGEKQKCESEAKQSCCKKLRAILLMEFCGYGPTFVDLKDKYVVQKMK